MFKKILAGALLCILFVNIVGSFPLFKIAQELIRKEMAENIEGFLPESELDIVVTTKNSDEIEWITIGKEFKYKSKRYDVIKVKTSANQIKYYCVKDLKETNLVDLMNSLIKKERDQNKNPLHSISRKQSKIWYYENDPTNIIKSEYNSIISNLYNYQEPFILPLVLNKVTPPPQIFS